MLNHHIKIGYENVSVAVDLGEKENNYLKNKII